MSAGLTDQRARLDPDALAALEEERDFLLRSIDDLEREYVAGDVDDHDYRTLRDDYTARAAAVLHAIEDGRAAFAAAKQPVSSRRRIGTIVGVLLVAVLAGALVTQASGRRGSGGLTGLDVTSASNRLGDCQALDSAGEADEARSCYSDILESLPANVGALTYRGWLQVREFDVEDGVEDLDQAIELVPESTAPYVFRASGRARSGDPVGAVADLAAFFENDPTEEEAQLARSLADGIVSRALDGCIAADVSGSRSAVEVLQCYRHVLAVDDGNATASVYLGWLLARSGELDDEALRLLDHGLETEPELSAGYVFRAALHAHRGEVDAARTDLERFAELDPPPDQTAAAERVRTAIEEGRDPLGR